MEQFHADKVLPLQLRQSWHHPVLPNWPPKEVQSGHTVKTGSGQLAENRGWGQEVCSSPVSSGQVFSLHSARPADAL